MLEGRNLDEVFGKLERVWGKRVGPLNKGRFSMFRGLRIIFKKTLQTRFYSPFPKKSLKIAVKTFPPGVILLSPPNNRWYAVSMCILLNLLQQRQMITVSRYSFSRYRSQKDTINNIPPHTHTILSNSIFWSRYIFINISFAFDASIIIYTSMYKVSEYCNHVLAKYKSWFPPLNWNNRESDWLIGKSRTKQVARIEQCSIVKTVAKDF